MVQDHFLDKVLVQRFGQVVIEAGLQNALIIPRHGVRRQGDDWNVTTGFLTSDLFVDLTGFLVCFQVWLLRGAL